MTNETTTQSYGIAAGELKAVIERIERLEQEKRDIADQIKEVYSEAKNSGYDVKILRKVISLLSKKPAERQEEQALIDIYLTALGVG